MQLGILNLLLGLPSGAAGNGQSGKNGSANDLFSLLLGDSNANSGQPGQNGLPEIFTDVSASALTAQEVAATDITAGDALTDLLAQQVTAEDASALLVQMEAMQGEMAHDQALFDQIKQTLATIRDTNVPQTLGAIVSQLPAIQHGAGHASALERMLSWMKDSITKPEEQDAPQDVAMVEDGASPIVQSLQASIFRDGDSGAAEAQKTDGSDTTTTIVPLTFQTSAEAPAWIKKLGTTPVRSDLDEAVPALTLAQNDALPEVTLPRASSAAFAEKMNALSSDINAQNAGDAPVTDADAVPVTTNVTRLPTHHNDNRVLSLGSAAHGALNHAPVAEQVHVAVRNASKEGLDTLTIQLEPADLGRVEVRLVTGADGQTQLSFIVDKADTLDALSRDARSLERSLQDAGIKADTGSMQFNLRQQPQSDSSGTGDGRGQQHSHNDDDDAAISPLAALAGTTSYSLALHDGVDIRA